MERWEHGSDFHWPGWSARLSEAPANGTQQERPAAHVWPGGAYLASGRDALRFLVTHGISARGWRRLWFPSYFCPEVVESIRSLPIELSFYPDRPTERAPKLPSSSLLHRGDVFLLMNYFGVRVEPNVSSLRGAQSVTVEIIEDHTHDPGSEWACASTADFCFSSLRKTLPIPDGAIVWSPRNHALPAAPILSWVGQRASRDRLEAMILKDLYLAGHAVGESEYRDLAVSSEDSIARGEVSGISAIGRALLGRVPLQAWRMRRAENFRVLEEDLRTMEGLCVLPRESEAACPFSVLIIFDEAERRERIRAHLIEEQIYPAVLWHLEDRETRGASSQVEDAAYQADVALSRRVLSIHCDMRYSRADMERVARTIRSS